MKQTINIVDFRSDTMETGDGDFEYAFEEPPDRLVLVCQCCGEPWCWMIPEGAPVRWEAVMWPCRECGFGTLSNLALAYRKWEIPNELLAREIECVAARTERPVGGTVYV